jgi:aspartate racemase
MRVIGLLGGMSWESTMPYYRVINETVRERLGGLHSARIVLYSLDFHDIEALQRSGEWAAAGALLAEAARSLEAAGADVLLLCTNTMHKVAGVVEAAIRIPLLHVADATAASIKAHGLSRVGLLGTRFTMEQDFYKDRLRDQHGVQVVVPDASDRDLVHRVIYDELCVGQVHERSRSEYRRIMSKLVERGAEGIVLGCTEVGLLVRNEDSAVPLFDTTRLHALEAVTWALQEQ